MLQKVPHRLTFTVSTVSRRLIPTTHPHPHPSLVRPLLSTPHSRPQILEVRVIPFLLKRPLLWTSQQSTRVGLTRPFSPSNVWGEDGTRVRTLFGFLFNKTVWIFRPVLPTFLQFLVSTLGGRYRVRLPSFVHMACVQNSTRSESRSWRRCSGVPPLSINIGRSVRTLLHVWYLGSVPELNPV